MAHLAPKVPNLKFDIIMIDLFHVAACTSHVTVRADKPAQFL